MDFSMMTFLRRLTHLKLSTWREASSQRDKQAFVWNHQRVCCHWLPVRA